MKKFIRVLSLVLAVLMLSSMFVACGDTQQDNNGGNDATTVAGLDSMNWGGEEYRVLGRKEGEGNMFTNFEIDREEMSDDVVGQEVWNRNANVMAKYGLDVVGTLDQSPASTARVFLEAGDDQYDLMMLPTTSFQSFAMEGYLLNMNELDYIDFEKDCWNAYANEQLTMGGKLYYTVNKFSLHDKHRTWMVYYNRDLANELNVGYLEDEVFAGTWTIDRLNEIAKQYAAEKDGVQGMSYNDQWGVALSDQYGFVQLAFASGFRISANGSDGYPQLVGATDQMLSILDKVYNITADKNTCYIWTFRPDTEKPSGRLDNHIFAEGHAVVLVDVISSFDDFKAAGVSFAFGTLPNPKYNEAQEDYYSLPNTGNGTLFGVPATVYDPAKAGFGLQALSEESVDTSYKAYIETKCKLQDVYDEDGAKCLDIIFENVVYDILQITDAGGIGHVVNFEISKEESNTYARRFSSLEKRANSELKKIKEAFAKY